MRLLKFCNLFFLRRKSHCFSRILSPGAPCESDYILSRNAETIIEAIMEELFCSGNTDGISHLYFGSSPFSADVIETVQRPIILSFFGLWHAWGLPEVSDETWHLSKTSRGGRGVRNLEIGFGLMAAVTSAAFPSLGCAITLFLEQEKKSSFGEGYYYSFWSVHETDGL